MSVRSYVSKTTCPNFTKISVRVTRGRRSVLPLRQCNKLRISGFVDDVMFSHNGANKPELKTTLVYNWSNWLQDGGTADKVAVDDCTLVTFLVERCWKSNIE